MLGLGLAISNPNPNPNQVDKRNSDGVTALMHAAVLAHAHIVEGLLERGADLNARDNDGFDALVAAATGGTAEVCRLLLLGIG